jgi:ribosome maturation factor RimP
MTSAVGELGGASSLWNTVKSVAEEFGVELFDIDLPSGSHGGVLRVYLSRPKQPVDAQAVEAAVEEADVEGVAGEETAERRTGVSFDDCSRVARKLLDMDEQQGFIPEGCMLEVSSPGVNRRLRLPQHFPGAVGERVRVKFRSEGNVYRVVTGVLSAVDGDVLFVNDEQSKQKEPVKVSLSDIKEARVDFKF